MGMGKLYSITVVTMMYSSWNLAGGPSINNFISGDAYSKTETRRGGHDALRGRAGSSENLLYGDAFEISCADDDPGLERKTYGGDDMLIGGVGSTKNHLYGDAVLHISGIIICGDDYLISKSGNDDMWGDIAFSYSEGNPLDLSQVTTGQDVFVFSAGNGQDNIHDFRHGEDKIELKGLVANFDALGTHITATPTDTVITFGTNTITVIGVTDLSAADFLFS